MRMRSLFRLAATAVLAVFAQGLLAQGLTIDIANGNPAALPSPSCPSPTNAGLPPETDAADVVRMDLNRSGQFRALPRATWWSSPVAAARSSSHLEHAQAGLHRGGPRRRCRGGALRVEFELYDVAKQERLLGLAITGQRSDLRGVAHQIADLVYEKILGVRGAF